MNSRRSMNEVDGASPGKIFIGGLAKETTLETFEKYFGKYGEIVDSVIMKDRHTQRPRGFGFITYADPAVVDVVIQEEHVINGKPVEIKRTIPKGASQGNDFKTKKIFVGGIPTSLTEEEFKAFFSKYGKVVEHEIIHDRATNRSRGFGFVMFESEKVVDDVLAGGNMIEMNGSRVEVKKAEPKKASNSAHGPSFGSEPRARSYGGGGGGYSRGFQDSYSGYGGGFSPASYGGFGGPASRFGDYGGYGGGDFAGGYGNYPGGGYGGFHGESSIGYPGRYGSYGGGGLGPYGGGGYGNAGGLGPYGRGGDGGYGNSGPGAGYGPSPGAYGGGGAGSGSGGAGGGGSGSAGGGGVGFYGNRSGYGTGSRYHPYSR
ncbi:hypothetical protein Drorol1_Dr00019480 [Drosera rotundifolia]